MEVGREEDEEERESLGRRDAELASLASGVLPAPLQRSTLSSSSTKAILIGALVLLCVALAIGLVREKRPMLNSCPPCLFSDYDAETDLESTSEEHEGQLGLGLALFTSTLCVCVLGSYLASRYAITTLPDCIVYVFIGIIVGTVLRLGGESSTAGYALPNKEQFFLFILPPIILEAGYSLNVHAMSQQAGAILLFAVVGTMITAVVFGVLLFLVGRLGVSYPFPFWQAMSFGALVSAVDPVATIAIFNVMKVNKALHYLVFGECVLNDAVAIVLYHTFANLVGPARPQWYLPIGVFLYIFFGSALVGALTGCIAAFVLKTSDLHRTPNLELSFLILTAFLPYFICEGLRMSGIMGILIGAGFLAHYARPNLSAATYAASEMCFKVLSYVAETFVFLYLGTALTTFNHSWDGTTVVFAILFTLVSRFANIYPLSYLINKYSPHDKINRKSQFIMWFSGLRGAIAFALSLNFPGGDEETRRVVISTTLAIVLFTVIVLGGGTLPILLLLRVDGADAGVHMASPRIDSFMGAHPQEDGCSDGFEDRREEGAAHNPSPPPQGTWLQRLEREFVRPYLSVRPGTRQASVGGVRGEGAPASPLPAVVDGAELSLSDFESPSEG